MITQHNISKVYTGARRHDTTTISVCHGEEIQPLKHIVRHSPTGMEWGYAGSGPADLSYSILHDIAGQDIAERLYQKFKHDKIAQLPSNMFLITGFEIATWLENQNELSA